MKTWKRVVLILLALLILSLAGLYVWQRENINALYKTFTTDSETIAKDLEEKRSSHHEALQEDAQVEITVKPVTTQQSNDLIDGKVAAEEVKAQMGVDTVPQAETGTAAATATKEDLVNQCVAALYAYKVDVMAHLGEMKQAAINEWNGLSGAERTTARKMEISMAGLRKCYDYEVEVDAKVKEILAAYRERMTAIGESTGPIDNLWSYYCDEKEAEKTYYFDKYLN